MAAKQKPEQKPTAHAWWIKDFKRREVTVEAHGNKPTGGQPPLPVWAVEEVGL
jgi:hypothetical protein